MYVYEPSKKVTIRAHKKNIIPAMCKYHLLFQQFPVKMCEILFSQANRMLKIEQKVEKKASNMSEAKLKENIYIQIQPYVMSLCSFLKYFIFVKKKLFLCKNKYFMHEFAPCKHI